ncbi:hypothetical protein NGY2020056_02040 [Vibrio cholerae]
MKGSGVSSKNKWHEKDKGLVYPDLFYVIKNVDPFTLGNTGAAGVAARQDRTAHGLLLLIE